MKERRLRVVLERLKTRNESGEMCLDIKRAVGSKRLMRERGSTSPRPSEKLNGRIRVESFASLPWLSLSVVCLKMLCCTLGWRPIRICGLRITGIERRASGILVFELLEEGFQFCLSRLYTSDTRRSFVPILQRAVNGEI